MHFNEENDKSSDLDLENKTVVKIVHQFNNIEIYQKSDNYEKIFREALANADQEAKQAGVPVPISDELAFKLKANSKRLGFSSQNEAVRVALTAFVNGGFKVIDSLSDVEIATPRLEKELEEALLSERIPVDPDKSLAEQLLDE
jgi:hypothetical protein